MGPSLATTFPGEMPPAAPIAPLAYAGDPGLDMLLATLHGVHLRLHLLHRLLLAIEPELEQVGLGVRSVGSDSSLVTSVHRRVGFCVAK